MDGMEQLARAICNARDTNFVIEQRVNNSPEPLRCMVYSALGEDIASAIDGTDLYEELIDHLEGIY